jgi:hypothetical protein
VLDLGLGYIASRTRVKHPRHHLLAAPSLTRGAWVFAVYISAPVAPDSGRAKVAPGRLAITDAFTAFAADQEPALFEGGPFLLLAHRRDGRLDRATVHALSAHHMLLIPTLTSKKCFARDDASAQGSRRLEWDFAPGIWQTSDPLPQMLDCEFAFRRSLSERRLGENLRLCQELERRGLHPPILWPQAGVEKFMVWQRFPTPETATLPLVDLVASIESMSEALIFPTGICPPALRLNGKQLQFTSWRLESFASLASEGDSSSSALEELLRHRRQQAHQYLRADKANQIAQALTTFCALSLLWARSTSWGELQEELTMRAEDLMRSAPDIMEQEMATGRPGPKSNKILETNSPVGLFWRQLWSAPELETKLRAASFFPQPSLSALFRQRSF